MNAAALSRNRQATRILRQRNMGRIVSNGLPLQGRLFVEFVTELKAFVDLLVVDLLGMTRMGPEQRGNERQQ